MKNKLPWDIKQECLWIVRGYDRRAKQYIAWRQEVIESGGANYITYVQDGEECRAYMPRGNQTTHAVEDKQLRLEAIEHYPEVIKMRAVEHAKLRIGVDLQNEESRQRLTNGIMLNCESGRDYPFEYLNLPEFSQRDFYRRKDNFLYDIAKFLKMI
ncbi:MAG: hypothetical protein VB078_00375 [Clostridiaceae bacterium]|nr:hypothetical protein [Clostridiaceae bacterium]